jgi:DNA invertase Pin-like site-specific DNA recombinase
MTMLLKQVRQVPSGIILPFDEVRHRVVVDAIDKRGGNYMLAARMLGIGKTTIYRWIRIYGYEHPKDQAAVLLAATPGGDGTGQKLRCATNARAMGAQP